MSWFFIALGAPFLWALVNISDQYLVKKYAIGTRGSGGLVLFSSLIGIFVACGIGAFTKDVFSIASFDKILLVITGGFTIAWVILYLFTLEIEDVSAVVPWFLTTPVFGYVLGYLFLGETLSGRQIVGSLIVMLGVFLISLDFSGRKKMFKRLPALYMSIACILIAISGILFKYVTMEGNFWVSSFWEYAGLGFFGVLLFLLVPKYRKEFIVMNSRGGAKIFAVNTASELLTVGGNLLTNFALLLAPVAMIYLVSSFQPAIVLILSVVGTKFFPHIIREELSLRMIASKTGAILLMIIGSVILFA